MSALGIKLYEVNKQYILKVIILINACVKDLDEKKNEISLLEKQFPNF